MTYDIRKSCHWRHESINSYTKEVFTKRLTYGFLWRQLIIFLELGLQPRLCDTCNVYCVGSLVIAQSESADPDIRIARWKRPA